jgi:pimeloyl-ACP methyl ester carboxylesterase
MNDPDIAPTRWFDGPEGRRLAYRFLRGYGPAVVFLPGYMSDMAGGKAVAVLQWAHEQGRACLLLDYSGCGQSEGDFADGTLSRWRDDVVALVRGLGIDRCVLVGSSMGGWLILLVAEALGEVAVALVGIAAAPDFTDWGFTSQQVAELRAGRTVFEDNPYGPDPTPTHADLWADGQNLLRLGTEIAFDGSVRLLHGQCDPDVPWDIAIRLAAALRSADVQVHLIKDGDHRLSRPGDVAILLGTLAALVGAAPSAA